MATRVIDIQLQRGDTYYFDFTVTGLTPTLDECLIWFTAKNNLTDVDDDAVIRKTLGAGIETTGDAAGTLTFEPDDTAAIVPPTGVNDPNWAAELFYDMQIKTPADEIFTILKGRVLVSMDITQAVA